MALQLAAVNAARGARWVGRGFALFGRKPLALTLLFVVFAAASTLVAALLPFVGGLLQLMALPLLSLGYLIAARSAEGGGPVHPGHFIAPLKAEAPRRRAQLALCASYGALALLILLLCGVVSDDAMTRLQLAIAEGDAGHGKVDAILAEPGLAWAALLFAGLGSLLSIPYWFAPALVHWGGQGVAQALFSSTLAILRNKGAFAVFMLVWFAVVAAASVGIGVLMGLLGGGRAAGLVLMPLALVCTAVFYVSQ
ncbi:MAG: hypothetical protein IT455_22450, partial [Planctomycetes bacterium]|nr:hypothetical protein [Planctomycetota bacterium]